MYFYLCLLTVAQASAQQVIVPAGNYPPPVIFTQEQDKQNMMDQLGIKALRPGPSGDEKAPNHANTDEALANPYPNLPDPLVLKNGKKVTTPAMWFNQRRPEIVEDFEREMYGRVPKSTPKVTWTVKTIDHEMVGRAPVTVKELVAHVDNTEYPLINVNITMTLVMPANAKGPVPLLMMFSPGRFPAPSQPNRDQVIKINEALKAVLLKTDPSLKAVFEEHPLYNPYTVPDPPNPFAFARQPAPKISPNIPGVAGENYDQPSTDQLIADGWGYAQINPKSIQADNGAETTRGIIGLVNKGQPRKPDDWGALRAWGWGAGRGLDYLETNEPMVDAKHVGIEGVSRYGKAALVTMAYDQRFYMVLVGSSGEGGAKLSRRNWGEMVESLSGGAHYWMAGNFMKYAAAESKFGSMNPGDLPVDAHELIALCAPRLTFISYGIPGKGDAHWLDHQGSYMATVAAGSVFKLLGVKDIGVSNDYHTEKMPPVNTGLLDGQLAWRQHDQGHEDHANMKYFIAWADKNMNRTSVAANTAR
ncbi:hypothetical protein BDD43_1110 [Mucilaginibacter gracilis]|uniref:4-O-methyl-glucuronoyl methylesterase-like domain-containing protein n=3 Tax=Sphingobacteriaceae TaxID=84566 RepID=H1YGZ6_9SPHI|nr:hypothetical protein Mucpa_3302 [Mucilaginibacter paludis DSM 18603]RKR80970.1 hypothetical protein BDD43_1110 [Mucilaginibacter gracilis]